MGERGAGEDAGISTGGGWWRVLDPDLGAYQSSGNPIRKSLQKKLWELGEKSALLVDLGFANAFQV